MTTPTPIRPGRRTIGEFDRRTLVLSASLLVGLILAGVVLFAVVADPGPAKDPAVAANEGGRPRIIQRPNEGVAPEKPGDRGGREQLALMGLMGVAVIGIGVVVFRGGGPKARAGRDAWKAAAATGQDGAVD